jgi:pimeloyl-ACP methyl ester carboxylesterase
LSTLILLSTILALPPGTLAKEYPELRRSSSHPMRYHFVPCEQQARRCAILIALAGADADFAGHARRFMKARGDRSVVLLVPCTFTSANLIFGSTYDRFRAVYEDNLIRRVGGGLLPDQRARLCWDEAGLLAIIRDLREQGLAGDIHLTGFSAGGILAWWMALRHPETFASVAPVCSNFPFWRIGQSDAAESPARQRLHVHAIGGGRDPLRQSRAGLPMPPTAATLIGTALLVAVACWARRCGLDRRGIAIGVALGVLVGAGMIAGRWSGNEVQTGRAMKMLRDLRYSRVDWTIVPLMEHEAGADHVFDWIADYYQPNAESQQRK